MNVNADGFVYGPTPLEAADHIKAGGVVERQDVLTGGWVPSVFLLADWRGATGRDVPRRSHRLVPLPVVPPVPVVVKVEDANDAQALIGRSIDGETVNHVVAWGDGVQLENEHDDVLADPKWGESVTVDPEPPPAPVEPDTVTVVLPRDVAQFYAAKAHLDHMIDHPVRKAAIACRAALAAEGDRR